MKPLKIGRRAFVETFVREELEKNGLEASYSTTATLRKLFAKLAEHGIQPGKKETRKIIETAARLSRIASAVRTLRNEVGEGPEKTKMFFNTEKVVWKPYGIHLITDNSDSSKKGQAVDLRSFFQRNPEGILHPKLIEILKRHDLSEKDVATVFSEGEDNEGIASHELEHSWSLAINEELPKTEELAAHYKGNQPKGIIKPLSSAWNLQYAKAAGHPPKMFFDLAILHSNPDLNTMCTPYSIDWAKNQIRNEEERVRNIEKRFLDRIFLKKRVEQLHERIEGLKKRLEAQESDFGEFYERYIKPGLKEFPEFLKADNESWSGWHDRAIKTIEAMDGKNEVYLRELEEFRSENGISRNFIAALLRTTPLEQIPLVIKAVVKIGKAQKQQETKSIP